MTPELKDKLIKGGIVLFILIMAIGIFTGGGEKLDKEVKARAKAVTGFIDSAGERITQNRTAYDKVRSSKEFDPVRDTAKKEQWAADFDRALQSLEKARHQYKSTLVPLIKENKPSVAPAVKEQIRLIRDMAEKAVQISTGPSLRFSRIRDIMADPEGYSRRAADHADRISAIITALESGVVAKALADFSALSEKINTRFAPALALKSRSRELRDAVRTQANRAGSGSVDWSAFDRAVLGLDQDLDAALKMEKTVPETMGQLYTSYTKILDDMKAEYQVTVVRESWDENSDFYNPRYARFTRIVDSETYDALTADGVDAIATVTSGFSGSRFSSAVGRAWESLGIDPGENWQDRSHNAANFWVEKAQESYFHKYILEREGQTEETGWQSVDAQTFNANLEFLGMAILAKPFGVFEEDSLTQAAPPGMAYVGNPEYGEWKEGENGDRFWSWYGKYMFFSNLFFFPPYYYSYRSWNGWHSNYRYSKPYFGKTGQGFKQFGTHGAYVKKSPRFQASTFAKSGGFRARSASVRGAGPGLRGGGPKSKGK